MRNVLMLAFGSGLIATGLLILATLWRSRASLQALPHRHPDINPGDDQAEAPFKQIKVRYASFPFLAQKGARRVAERVFDAPHAALHAFRGATWSPKQVSEETDTGVPGGNNAPNVAALVGREKSGNNTPKTDVISAVNELAKEILIEEARRASDVEATRDSTSAIVAEAEQQAQQILKNAAGQAQDAIKAVRMATDRATDEIGSALTSIHRLLPASNDSADGSNNKLAVGNGARHHPGFRNPKSKSND